MKERLTVILTIYDIKKEYVIECLESIEKQTFKDFIVLVMDDCSENDYSWVSEYPKVKYIKNEENMGMSKSVNKAFSMVNTEYCVRLGSDDIFDKTLFQKEIDFLDNNPDYIAVCCNLQTFGKYNYLIERPEPWDINDILNKKFRKYGYNGGFMFRSYILKKFRLNEKMRICEDFDFQIRLLTEGKIKSIHEPLYLYRKHDSQITAKATAFERRRNIYRSIYELKWYLEDTGKNIQNKN